MADQLPRTAGRRAGRADSEAGLTALAFSPDNPDQFVLGSEGGGLFLCSFASEVPIAGEFGRGREGVDLSKGAGSGGSMIPVCHYMSVTVGGDDVGSV